MKYFENFPRTIYTFNKNTLNQQAVTNILARSTFLRSIKDNVDIAYDYTVKDTDNPEIIAHKIYGDPYRSWIVLLFNNIYNPNYDWPLKLDALESYISNKYNQTINQAKTTIHHYEKVINKKITYNGSLLFEEESSNRITEWTVNFSNNSLMMSTVPTTADTSVIVSTDVVDYTTYILTITTSHKAVSNYQYEFDLNEEKRRIKILDAKYVQRVETEFEQLMRDD
jgi:hypothetical protein